MPRIHSIYPVHEFHLIIEFENREFRVVDLLLFVQASSLNQGDLESVQVRLCPDTNTVLLPDGQFISANILYDNSLPLQLPFEK
ncbi:hypothetical protein [Paenibacillus eucommiae]|uniref:Uncharacterized protein n=1 Tax=Paenibacillus eucommiae TaxID=1355755 RepID=A0ABS4IXM2_9BACL|nr:hypothetical protein [Paenibacillus eucommiae]MBP1991840.1 hypothetical protein [Paenibacillus eucommiae]